MEAVRVSGLISAPMNCIFPQSVHISKQADADLALASLLLLQFLAFNAAALASAAAITADAEAACLLKALLA